MYKIRFGTMALTSLLFAGCMGPMPQEEERTYEITTSNLTSTQPLTPPLLAVHTARTRVFQVGSPSSEGLRMLAEVGNNMVLAGALRQDPEVQEVVAATAPMHRIGGPGANQLTFTIAARGEGRLSIASMLGCTNDGFTGLDSVALPTDLTPVVLRAGAYDAGTEENNELFTHLPDPCGIAGPVPHPADGDLRNATTGVIQPHPGLTVSNGDPAQGLSADYQWTNPVLQVTIQRKP